MTTNKVFVALIVFIASISISFTQGEKSKVDVSLRFAPTISMTGAKGDSKYWDFEKNKSHLKFNGGLSFDIFLDENVSISTGVWYTGKRSKFTVSSAELNRPSADNSNQELIDVSLNYVEVPLLFKGFTNNLSENLRLYFNVGGVFGIKVSEAYAGKDQDRPLQSYDPEGEYNNAKYASLFDASLLIGGGTEIAVGTSNKIYIGLDYSLGLANIINKKYVGSLSQSGNNTIEKGTNYAIKNKYLAIVGGFKF